MAGNPTGHKRSKHIDIRHHFLRELVEKKAITVIYTPTSSNLADILTKNLPKAKFYGFREQFAGLSLSRGVE
jgi:hypothetical protein